MLGERETALKAPWGTDEFLDTTVVRPAAGGKGAHCALAKALQSGATTQLSGLPAAGAGGTPALAAEPGINADVCCRSETVSGNVEGGTSGATRVFAIPMRSRIPCAYRRTKCPDIARIGLLGSTGPINWVIP